MVRISYQAFNEWMKDPRKVEFGEEIKRAEAQFKQANLTIIQRAAKKAKTWQAAAWLLERKHRDEFALPSKWELTGRGGKPLLPQTPAVDLSKFDDAQLRLLLALAEVKPKAEGAAGANGNGGGAA